jgi:hypothetical protein
MRLLQRPLKRGAGREAAIPENAADFDRVFDLLAGEIERCGEHEV